MQGIWGERSAGSRSASLLLIGGIAISCGGDFVGQDGRRDGEASALLEGTAPRRVIIISVDSLNPDYLDLDANAAGQGSDGDWLMPNLRAFIDTTARWDDARAHLPSATDMNHLNIVAGTDSGMTGLLGVFRQADDWGSWRFKLQESHVSVAKYPNGNQVETLFEKLERATGDAASTAYLSNKGWVAEMYTPTASLYGVDVIVNGDIHPPEIPAPTVVSFYDNPASDPDWECDPESLAQTEKLDTWQQDDPADHPRDMWLAEAALHVMDTHDPDMIYVNLADLDHAQHMLGAVADPDEWVELPVEGELAVDRPPTCGDRPGYHLVSKRNPALYKEPILDLIRDVDLAVGHLVDGLEAGGYLEDAVVMVVSDHNMINYYSWEGLEKQSDIYPILGADPTLITRRSFYAFGGGSVAGLYWRPDFKQRYPGVVAAAKARLEQHTIFNPQTSAYEVPWVVLTRGDMITGREELGIRPMELMNPHFLVNEVWPDLYLLTRSGYSLHNGFATGQDNPLLRMNAGHGGPATISVLTAARGLDYPSGAHCGGTVYLSDVGVTLADMLGFQFEYQRGEVLSCGAVAP